MKSCGREPLSVVQRFNVLCDRSQVGTSASAAIGILARPQEMDKGPVHLTRGGHRVCHALAGVSQDTVSRLERGEALRERTVEAICLALEARGIEFTNGDRPGVRLKSWGP